VSVGNTLERDVIIAIFFLPQTHTADLSTYPLLIMPFILNSYDPMSLPLRCVFLLSYTLTRIKHLHTLQSLWVSFHRFNLSYCGQIQRHSLQMFLSISLSDVLEHHFIISTLLQLPTCWFIPVM